MERTFLNNRIITELTLTKPKNKNQKTNLYIVVRLLILNPPNFRVNGNIFCFAFFSDGNRSLALDTFWYRPSWCSAWRFPYYFGISTLFK